MAIRWAVRAVRAAPGDAARLSSSDAAGRFMLMGGEAFDDPALRLLELRLLAPRPDQPGQGGLEGRPLPAVPGDDQEYHPAARGAEDGQLSMTEHDAGLPSHRRHTERRRGRAEDGAADHPAARLSQNRIAPGARWRRPRRRFPSGHARPARLRRVGPARGRRSLQNRHPSTICSRSPMRSASSRFALVGHDWGGAIAWGAALRGDPRIAASASSTRRIRRLPEEPDRGSPINAPPRNI